MTKKTKILVLAAALGIALPIGASAQQPPQHGGGKAAPAARPAAPHVAAPRMAAPHVGARSAHGSAAAHGGAARCTGSADGSTAAHGHPARHAGITHGTTHGDATCRAPADGRTTSSPGGNKSQFSGGSQSRGTTTTAPGVPSATRLAPAGSARRPGAHQSAVATTEPAKHASTATR